MTSLYLAGARSVLTISFLPVLPAAATMVTPALLAALTAFLTGWSFLTCKYMLIMEPLKPVADFRVLCRDMAFPMAMITAAPLTLQSGEPTFSAIRFTFFATPHTEPPMIPETCVPCPHRSYQTGLIYWVHESSMVALFTVGPSLLMKLVCVEARHSKSLCVISIPVSST